MAVATEKVQKLYIKTNIMDNFNNTQWNVYNEINWSLKHEFETKNLSCE